MSSKFVRVHMGFEYIVERNDDDILEAKEAVWEDVCNAVKYGEPHFHVEDAPHATEADVPEFIGEMRRFREERKKEEASE